jgi:hypothetical protein
LIHHVCVLDALLAAKFGWCGQAGGTSKSVAYVLYAYTMHANLATTVTATSMLIIKQKHSHEAARPLKRVSHASATAMILLEHLQFSETTLTHDYRLQLSSELSLN